MAKNKVAKKAVKKAPKKTVRKAAVKAQKKAVKKAAAKVAIKVARKTVKKAVKGAAKKAPKAKPAGGVKKVRKYVYYFLPGKVHGNAKMKMLLGGKGANLAEMAKMGIPVPPGFTITTEVCSSFFESKGRYPKGLAEQVRSGIEEVGAVLGRKFGDPLNPLLFSVRSGAPASMPGMMDTILNLGLNDAIVERLTAQMGDSRFAYDAYRRFVMMYADVVLDEVVDPKRNVKKYEFRDHFEEILDAKKKAGGWEYDYQIPAGVLKEMVSLFKAYILEKTGVPFPEEPVDQLWGAVGAVFRSWNNPRAIEYRKINRIPADWGTAANVQSMVFGNMGEGSATGVAFSRDPATGENRIYGEWLPNAQGEDVVAGIRTPMKLDKATGGKNSLEHMMPELYNEFIGYAKGLERHFTDMMDLEFTIEKGKLWMLQSRVGKRTALASIRAAVEMVRERLITKEEALRRIDPNSLNQLLRPVFDGAAKKEAIAAGRLLAKGLPAGPGAATGRIVFDAVKATEEAPKVKVVLVRAETSPEDIHGMKVAEGILTQRGGMTSHAALVGRQMGKVCVVGCEALAIDYTARTMTVGGRVLREGDFISIDGTAGEVIEGQIATKPSEILQVLEQRSLDPKDAPVYQIYEQIMKWADSARRLGVRTNADLPEQARIAVAFGAEGIGLCRTEHMFFGEGKIDAMREMIVAPDAEARKKALAKLLPLQREDFAGIFRAMEGRPVTIRTLDPPLHEFLPHDRDKIGKLAEKMGISPKVIEDKVEELKEFNPMLGHRGCRLGISYPEITAMQARAIFEAAVLVYNEGYKVKPEIMIPLVGNVKEFILQKEIVVATAKEVFAEQGVRVPYKVGTMIEVPRAAITADKIAVEAEFFSYGTNDMTQMALGISRDDAGSFLNRYLETGIFKYDPFEVLDTEGVGELVRIGIEKGRRTRPDLKVGICGEHGGEPGTVQFCHEVGMSYVSCSPYRVPIARLAAARAALPKTK